LRAKIQKLGETIEKRVKRKISIKERALITTPTAVCGTQTMTMRQDQVPKGRPYYTPICNAGLSYFIKIAEKFPQFLVFMRK